MASTTKFHTQVARVQKFKHQSSVFADQSSQGCEHAEMPNGLSHAKLMLGIFQTGLCP